jgi:hypothetical protein
LLKGKVGESWSLGVSSEHLPHACIYVRDSCRLITPRVADVPPALEGDIVYHNHVLTHAQRVEAGQDWMEWWRDIASLIVRAQLGLHMERGAFSEEGWQNLGRAYAQLADGPDFLSLANQPSLRMAAQSCFREGYKWFDAGRDPRGLSVSPFDATEAGRIAEAVADRHQVSLGSMRAGVVVLQVQGLWWQMCPPGGIICSAGYLSDARRRSWLLEQAFEARWLSEP